MPIPKVTFLDVECEVVFGRYASSRGADDRIAIDLVCPDGEHMATATVNLPDEPLPEGCVFIKDWSENAGMVAALEAAGIVKDTGLRVPTGFTAAKVCKLLVGA